MNQLDGNKKILLLGCGGLLGSLLAEDLSEDHRIIGVGLRAVPSNQKFLFDYYSFDMSVDPDDSFEKIFSKHSDISAVICNAAQYNLVPLVDCDTENFKKEFQLALVTPILISKYLSKVSAVYPKNNYFIVNISSGSGLGVVENQNQATYSTLKAGLNMLTKHMASELEKFNICVNAVAPGSLQDELTLQTTIKEVRSSFTRSTYSGQICYVNGDKVEIF